MRGWRILALLVVAALVILAIVLVGTGSLPGAPRTFLARLSGEQVVPPVDTRARGDAAFQLREGGRALGYKLDVSNLDGVTAAHIHLGQPGESGPVVAPLYAGPAAEGGFSGTLAQGTLRAADLTGLLKGRSIADLVGEIEAGNTYVNVHTQRYPSGEIRGQIR